MGDGPHQEGYSPNDPFGKHLFANIAGIFKNFSFFSEFLLPDFAL
jgi:hypothetical protein